MLPLALLKAIAMAPALPPTEITVYNQGFGLIKEARTLSLKKGRQAVGVEDVAALIAPSSVSIRSLAAPDAINVLEQNYQYDLIGPVSILAKAVGERLRIVGPKETVEGVLISSPGQNGGGLVIRTDDGRIVLDPQGQITLAKVPNGLITRPTLLWDLESDRDGGQNVELSYITRGLTWTADYVLTLDGEGKAAIQGWVTMNNQSGTTYRDARLKLLAGDVNQLPQGGGMGGAGGGTLSLADARKAFNEESLFEYHLYTLQRPSTIADKETKQIGLLSGDGVPVTKRLIVDATRENGRFYPSEGEIGTGDLAPQVRIEFTNDQKSGLGIPPPGGPIPPIPARRERVHPASRRRPNRAHAQRRARQPRRRTRLRRPGDPTPHELPGSGAATRARKLFHRVAQPQGRSADRRGDRARVGRLDGHREEPGVYEG